MFQSPLSLSGIFSGRAALVVCLGFAFLTHSPEMSYADETVPAGETAGAEESRFREERDFQKHAEEKRREFEEEAPIESKLPPASPEETNGTKFFVKDVHFLGNRSIPSSELAPLTAHLENREVTLAEIQAAVSEIKKLYRSKGFVAAYAYVPQQQLRESILKIDILEGRLGEIRIADTQWFSTRALNEMFRMKPADVLTHEALRRDLARLNKHPDIEASAVLEPGKQTGSTDVALKFEERFPFHVSLSANNSGTKNTGKERYGLTLTHTNLLGRLDEISGSTQFGQHSKAFGGSYVFPILPKQGTKLGYSVTYADVDIEGDFAPLNAEGDAFTQSFYALQPVIESKNLDGTLKVGIDSKEVENRLLGFVSGKDDLTILNAALDLDQSDAHGKTMFSNSLHFGLADFLGSSPENDPNATRLGTGSDFFVYRGLFLRFQKLFGDGLGTLKIAGQATSDSLAPSEQMRFGGARSIRGYKEGEYLADYGIQSQMDLYMPLFFLPEEWKMPFTNESIKSKVQLLAFADLGAGRLNDPLPAENKSRNLAGIGAGARMHLYDKFYGRVEWGFPVGDRPFDNGNSVFYFSVSWEAM